MPRCCSKSRNTSTCVVGSRFTFGGGMSDLLRYYLSYLYNIFLRLTLGTRLTIT